MKKIDLLKKIEEAKIKQKAGNPIEANQIFQVLLKLNNDSFDLLYAYGLFCRDLKNFNLAKRVFLNLINKFPSSINPYILLAELLKIENKFKDAEKVLLKAIKIAPNHGDLLYNFAISKKKIAKNSTKPFCNGLQRILQRPILDAPTNGTDGLQRFCNGYFATVSQRPFFKQNLPHLKNLDKN